MSVLTTRPVVYRKHLPILRNRSNFATPAGSARFVVLDGKRLTE
jgi:hypothetical protein